VLGPKLNLLVILEITTTAITTKVTTSIAAVVTSAVTSAVIGHLPVFCARALATGFLTYAQGDTSWSNSP
jgi:hypothetical protein